MKTFFVSLLDIVADATPSLVRADDDTTKAVAVVSPTANSKVTGTVTFTKSGDDVKVVADISGLTPGKHGFHIHEFGDCSAPDGKAAGGHFNPPNSPHCRARRRAAARRRS